MRHRGLGIVVLVILLFIMTANGEISARELTIFFNVFVMLQFWNLFKARSLRAQHSPFRGLLKNKSFLFIALAILLGKVAIVQFGGVVFRTTPLGFTNWVIITIAISAVFWLGDLRRHFQ